MNDDTTQEDLPEIPWQAEAALMIAAFVGLTAVLTLIVGAYTILVTA